MPSPGQQAILSDIATTTYTVEGGFETQFSEDNQTTQQLASSLDSGWTSSSPTTPTTMTSVFAAEFTNISGDGLMFLMAIAKGIDAEVVKWVGSWNATSGVHLYVITAATTYAAIKAEFTVFWSAGVDALATKVAQIFASNFEQEVG